MILNNEHYFLLKDITSAQATGVPSGLIIVLNKVGAVTSSEMLDKHIIV